MYPKILVIRFSSFGDIIQSLSVVDALKAKYPKSEIHWATKSDFGAIVSSHPGVEKTWTLKGSKGLKDLYKLANELKSQNFDLVYDAHSNLRSNLIRFFIKGKLIVRPKERFKRIMLFYFRKNLFPKPYRGIKSYLAPLKSIGVSTKFSPTKLNLPDVLLKFESFIALVPSAAWEMKRWPLEYFKQLINDLPEHKFIILGGPDDLFCQELEDIDPKRVQNLAGKLSIIESMGVVSISNLVISADTGIIHVADLIGKKGLSLMGPTAFGFPTGDHIKTLEVSLPCRPCSKDGRGKCSQKIYKKCMIDITPEMVAKYIS